MNFAARSCPSCGAEVDFPPDQIGQVCAFCDTPLVHLDDVERAPVDQVANFLLDRTAAALRLQQRLQGSWLAPEGVRKAAHLDALDDVLVPFWCYDASARSSYRADVGIHWYETVTYTVKVNGKTQVRTKQVKHTEWHPLSGSHVHLYRNHLVSGSVGITEEEANELEPFDLGKLHPYDPTRIAGRIAERPTVAHEEARKVAAHELAQLENSAIRKFLPGDEVRGVHNQTTTEIGEVRLVLLPVWVSSWRHKDKVFRLLVNGQTGEVVGLVPKSGLKIFALVIAFFILVALTVLVVSS